MALTQLTVQESDLYLVVSKLVDKNYYAQLSTQVATSRNGNRGIVNVNYEGDAATGAVRIGVPQVQRPETFTRKLGGTSNGDFVNDDAIQSNKFRMKNRTLTLNVDEVFDPILELPRIQQGAIQFSAIENMAYQISGQLVEHIDKYTSQKLWDGILEFGSTAGIDYANVHKVSTASGTDLAQDDMRNVIIKASEQMTNLPDNGYDLTVPENGRSAIMKRKAINNLRLSGTYVVGSDYAYKTFVEGVESYGLPYGLDSDEVLNERYMGTFEGIHTFVILDRFLPTPDSGELLGIVTHPMATTRAMTPKEQRVVWHPDYLGDVFQTQVRFGVLVHRPWQPQAIVTSDWTEPVA